MSLYPEKGGGGGGHHHGGGHGEPHAAAPVSYDAVEFNLAALADASASGAVPPPDGDPVDWSDLEAEDELTGQPCWGCGERLGRVAIPRSNRLMFGLARIHAQCAGLGGELLYQQVAAYHANCIVPAKAKAGEPCTPWPLAMVRAHYSEHARTPRDNLVDAQRTCARVVKRIRSQVFVKKNGRYISDHENLKRLREYLALARSLNMADSARLFR